MVNRKYTHFHISLVGMLNVKVHDKILVWKGCREKASKKVLHLNKNTKLVEQFTLDRRGQSGYLATMHSGMFCENQT